MRLPCRKLSPRFIGPFPITQQINPVTYHLQLPAEYKIHPVFHVSLLKPHHPSVLPSTEPGEAEEPPLLLIVDDGAAYLVQDILDSRGRGGHLECLADWEGYGPEERSWVPRNDILDPSLLDDFHARHPNQPAPRGRGRPPRQPHVSPVVKEIILISVSAVGNALVFWVYLATGRRSKWQRLPAKNVYYYRCPDHRRNYVMSFAFCFDREDDVYQFAYCYPYTYSRLQHYLSSLEQRNLDYLKREQLGLSVDLRQKGVLCRCLYHLKGQSTALTLSFYIIVSIVTANSETCKSGSLSLITQFESPSSSKRHVLDG
ncbi:hypothetical protein QTP86_012920 [Hemibagrus guttatus]|nr:hypothetical protein QTP86_012920 [Hemibagrus guttatus]